VGAETKLAEGHEKGSGLDRRKNGEIREDVVLRGHHELMGDGKERHRDVISLKDCVKRELAE
jgi:hypothetical protein